MMRFAALVDEHDAVAGGSWHGGMIGEDEIDELTQLETVGGRRVLATEWSQSLEEEARGMVSARVLLAYES